MFPTPIQAGPQDRWIPTMVDGSLLENDVAREEPVAGFVQSSGYGYVGSGLRRTRSKYSQDTNSRSRRFNKRIRRFINRCLIKSTTIEDCFKCHCEGAWTVALSKTPVATAAFPSIDTVPSKPAIYCRDTLESMPPEILDRIVSFVSGSDIMQLCHAVRYCKNISKPMYEFGYPLARLKNLSIFKVVNIVKETTIHELVMCLPWSWQTFVERDNLRVLIAALFLQHGWYEHPEPVEEPHSSWYFACLGPSDCDGKQLQLAHQQSSDTGTNSPINFLSFFLGSKQMATKRSSGQRHEPAIRPLQLQVLDDVYACRKTHRMPLPTRVNNSILVVPKTPVSTTARMPMPTTTSKPAILSRDSLESMPPEILDRIASFVRADHDILHVCHAVRYYKYISDVMFNYAHELTKPPSPADLWPRIKHGGCAAINNSFKVEAFCDVLPESLQVSINNTKYLTDTDEFFGALYNAKKTIRALSFGDNYFKNGKPGPETLKVIAKWLSRLPIHELRFPRKSALPTQILGVLHLAPRLSALYLPSLKNCPASAFSKCKSLTKLSILKVFEEKDNPEEVVQQVLEILKGAKIQHLEFLLPTDWWYFVRSDLKNRVAASFLEHGWHEQHEKLEKTDMHAPAYFLFGCLLAISLVEISLVGICHEGKARVIDPPSQPTPLQLQLHKSHTAIENLMFVQVSQNFKNFFMLVANAPSSS
ncbi:hypothetical protein BJ741DRAFT_684461 [Chytriomyces cf. hyalinus JEL632]|nr:hypothetical protein BJ741DRAFT_684461 [Chytriomyces cf. hyalinus JEL632]